MRYCAREDEDLHIFFRATTTKIRPHVKTEPTNYLLVPRVPDH
jgi:hypothetical protein